MKVLSIILLSSLLLAVADAEACAISLNKADCDACKGDTHLFVCSTCHQCTSDTATCSSACNNSGFKSGTNKCISCGSIANCPRSEISCTVASNAVTANTKTCTTCAAGYQKKAGTSGTSDDSCVAVGIANCAATSVQGCTVASGATTCTANTKTCTTCAAGYQLKTGTSGTSDDMCVAVGIANCAATSAQGCTVASGATTCTANTKSCTTCADNFKKVTGTSGTSDDSCTACISTSAACGSGCGSAQNVYTSGTKCVKCDATSPEAGCNSCAGWKFAWGKCRLDDAATSVIGRDSNELSCPTFTNTNAPSWTYKTCAETYVAGDVATCAKCTEDACSEGTCKTSTNEFKAGKCSAKSGGGGTGGNDTKKTNNTNNTNDNSTAYANGQTLVAFVAIAVALFC